jgi:hypothetical protein
MKKLLLGCMLLLLMSGALPASAAEAEQKGDPAAGDRPENAVQLEPARKNGGPAANATGPAAHNGTVYRLAPVDVQEETRETGRATIGGKALRSMPSHTGSLTEALKGMPNVQFSNDMISGQTAGEIAPPRISISGAKPYENNFMIDGMSITNRINPSGLGDSASQNDLTVGGGDQTLFYDTQLLDNITVYTSNIPASFGGFVGGVVDGELRDPKMDEWHFSVTGKHTRSKWFTLRGVDENSEKPSSQPRFSINTVSATAEGPVSDTAGLLLAVSRKHSVIPLKREENDGTINDGDQHRISDNFMAKMVMRPSDDLTLKIDATYAPYEEKRWREKWPDSDWFLQNDAYRLGLQAEYETQHGTLSGKTSYMLHGYNRESSSAHRYSNTSTDEQRGGVGDLKQDTQELDMRFDFDSVDYTAGMLTWNVSTGVLWHNTLVDFTAGAAEVDVDVLMAGNRRILTNSKYLEHSQELSLNTLGYYAQTELTLGNFTLTPGLRADYDDFSTNLDIAHRLKAEYDTFGDGSLRLTAGLNRYYGGQLSAYALRRYRPQIVFQQRDMDGDGVFESSKTTYGTDKTHSMSGLDTPYTDEISAGVQGDFLGFEYGVELVKRDYKNQLVSKSDDKKSYYMTNEGKSEYEGITLTLARAVQTQSMGDHVFGLGITKSKRKTFNGSYDEDVYDEANGVRLDYDKVYYNGELTDRNALPADDYNAPVVLTFSWQGHFMEDTLRLNTVTRWRDSATGLMADSRFSDDTPHGTTSGSNTNKSDKWMGEGTEYHNAYKHGVISGGFVTDLGVEWDVLKEEEYTLTMLMDVNNVFDESQEVSVTEGEASRGRSFYAGFRCEF